MFQWNLSFFGLPEGYRAAFHEEIFNLWYYGGGGTIQDLYDLPVDKRRFFLKLLESAKQQEKDQVDKQSKQNTSAIPRIPSYHTSNQIPKK